MVRPGRSELQELDGSLLKAALAVFDALPEGIRGRPASGEMVILPGLGFSDPEKLDVLSVFVDDHVREELEMQEVGAEIMREFSKPRHSLSIRVPKSGPLEGVHQMLVTLPKGVQLNVDRIKGEILNIAEMVLGQGPEWKVALGSPHGPQMARTNLKYDEVVALVYGTTQIAEFHGLTVKAEPIDKGGVSFDFFVDKADLEALVKAEPPLAEIKQGRGR